MNEMEIKKVKLFQIKEYEKNPRKNDEAVDSVAESIKQVGYCSPILVDENYVILAGHTRLKALKKLGWEEANVIVRNGLTDEQKRKYRLLDNKTAEIAEWDLELLELELDDLDFGDFDFEFNFGEAKAEESVSVIQQNTQKEYSEEDFSDEKFKCECPRCGFKFNP